MLGNQGIKNRGSPAIPWTARLPRWSEWRDLNPRPHGPEPCALPTALHPDSFCIIAGFSRPVKCRPAVRRRTPGRSNQLHRGREQRQDMRMHRLLKNRSKRISLAPVCRALKKEMRTLVGTPHGGAARSRRTSVFACGENLGAGRVHFARAFKIKRVEDAFGGQNPKRKTHLSAYLSFCHALPKKIQPQSKSRPEGGSPTASPAKYPQGARRIRQAPSCGGDVAIGCAAGRSWKGGAAA